jgi:hypothetical protein
VHEPNLAVTAAPVATHRKPLKTDQQGRRLAGASNMLDAAICRRPPWRLGGPPESQVSTVGFTRNSSQPDRGIYQRKAWALPETAFSRLQGISMGCGTYPEGFSSTLLVQESKYAFK